MTSTTGLSQHQYQLPLWTKDWRGAAAGTMLTAVCAQVSFHLPFTPVPVTLQVFAVLLSGLLLGSRLGAVSQLQYLVLGALGAPIFADFNGGFMHLFGITGGYLLSYPFAAWISGLGKECTLQRRMAVSFSALALIYLMGCMQLSFFLPHATLFTTFIAGAGWFLVWDIVKLCAAVSLSRLFVRQL